MTKAYLNSGYANHGGAMLQPFRNMYFEPTPKGPDQSIRFQRPGIDLVSVIGSGPIRCKFKWQGHEIVVSGTQCFWDETLIGTIPGDDLCRFAISDEEIVIVANSRPWYITPTSVDAMVDSDLFSAICDVVLLSGRFVYFSALDSQFQWSDVGDARSIDGLSFATADENSAQICRAAFVYVDDMVIFMTTAVEWWSATTDPDAPFQRSPGRKYNKGIAARATTALLDNTVFFLGSDKIVYRAQAVPLRVSNFDIENLIEQLSDDDLRECSAFGLVINGHTFYVLNLPGKGTWALDIATKEWAEWHSYGKDRFRGTVYDGQLLGDAYSGNLYKFNLNSMKDDGDAIERVVSCWIPLPAGNMVHFNLYLKCVRGVGQLVEGYGSNPVVEMRFSDDEGYNFTPWMEAPLGAWGDRTDTAKAIWTQLGNMSAPGRLIEFRCTDPVFFAPSVVRFNEKLL